MTRVFFYLLFLWYFYSASLCPRPPRGHPIYGPNNQRFSLLCCSSPPHSSPRCAPGACMCASSLCMSHISFSSVHSRSTPSSAPPHLEPHHTARIRGPTRGTAACVSAFLRAKFFKPFPITEANQERHTESAKIGCCGGFIQGHHARGRLTSAPSRKTGTKRWLRMRAARAATLARKKSTPAAQTATKVACPHTSRCSAQRFQ